MDKQQLASKIWKAANKMRGSLDANDYKDLILGLMFYKFLSGKEVTFFLENEIPEDLLSSEVTSDKPRRVAMAQAQLGYFIDYEDLFSTWEKNLPELKPSWITEAALAFDAHVNPAYKSIFREIFTPLSSAIPKLGTDATAQAKKLRDLIRIVRDIPTDGREGYDVLGYVYEYLIANFAANAGKSAGEFYTPHQVALVMAEIVGHHLKDRRDIEVYDATSGSASLLLNVGDAIARRSGNPDSIKYYAQEKMQAPYALTRMNLVMRGIRPANIITRQGDSLDADWPMIDPVTGRYETLLVDAVVSNPPYSAEWDRPKQGADPRFSYGLAPEKTADYAFLLHELYHLKSDGILAIVLPHGVLFRGGEEEAIRTQLVNRNHIETIIGLPPNIFYGTGIATIVMVLKKDRGSDDSILFIDASRGFKKVGKKNELRDRDVRKIVDTVIERKTEKKYSRLASRKEVQENGYNLNIPRYVDSSDPAETWDIYATMFGGIPQDEIDTLATYWDSLPELRGHVFDSLSGTHTNVKIEAKQSGTLSEFIHEHQSVKAFKTRFAAAFAGWQEALSNLLVDRFDDIDMTTIEAELRGQLFQRLESVPIVDDYAIYQIFADHWSETARDLEVLKGQGWEQVRRVEPHYVMKKVKGVEKEVQEGWIGTILPFELVQQELLTEDFEDLAALQSRLTDAEARVSELFDSLSEEQLGSGETSVTNAAGTAFAATNVKNRLSSLMRDISTPEIEILNEYLEKRGAARKRLVAEHPEVTWSAMTPSKSGDYAAKVVRGRIEELRKATQFEDGALEPVLIEALDLLDEVKIAKKEVKARETKIHQDTKQLIENLDDDTAKELLRTKWAVRLLKDIQKVPGTTVGALVEQISALDEKYATTLSDIGRRGQEAQTRLSQMMGQLTGPERDMEGIAELASILEGGRS